MYRSTGEYITEKFICQVLYIYIYIYIYLNDVKHMRQKSNSPSLHHIDVRSNSRSDQYFPQNREMCSVTK